MNDNILEEILKDATLSPYRQVFYASPDFISISKLTDGTYIDVNPGFEHLTGFSRAEVLGKSSVDIGLWIEGQDRIKFIQALERNGKLNEYPTKFRIRSGEICDVEFSGGIIEIQGEQILVSVVRDVTQRNRKDRELQEQREKLEQDATALALINAELKKSNAMLKEAQEQLIESEKMAALSVVVAGVAHEINTPVGTGYTLITYFQKKSQEFLESIKNGSLKRSDLQTFADLSSEVSSQLAVHLSQAANLVKHFKQIAVDQTSEDLCYFNLRSHLEDIITRLSPLLIKSSHTLELDCPPDIHINSFKDSIYKVVSNLVENAILHAFPSGAVGTMRISIKSTEEKIILKFSDDGMGIPAEHLPKIFDPFFTTSSGTAGSGLGLSIVFNLVTNKLHGKISCTSAVSEGTIFHIEFPIVET